jgi:hypothetical protein
LGLPQAPREPLKLADIALATQQGHGDDRQYRTDSEADIAPPGILDLTQGLYQREHLRLTQWQYP